VEQRLFDAMAAWRLLPDERVLASAGTGHETWPANELVAVLNIARFVTDPGLPSCHIDMAGIASTAELAVEVLDNVAERASWSPGCPGRHLRIGMAGLADAFFFLGVAYSSPRASHIAHDVSRHMAAGCLGASLRLARDRGPRCQVSQHLPVAYKLRELSPSLAVDAARYGLRQSRLTAITSQPRLAQFANNVTNAVDPLLQAHLPRNAARSSAAHMGGSMGYAIEWSRRHDMDPSRLNTLLEHAAASTRSQVALRSSMQMWIDEPILYGLSNHDGDEARMDVHRQDA